MKKLFLLTILLLALLACSKQAQPTRLDVVITQHPVGGYNVSTVSCTFTVTETGEAKPVIITADWLWENGLHTGMTVKQTNTYAVNNGTQKAFTTTYSAASGYAFMNYLWLRLRWTDDTGVHELESIKCYCN